MRLFYPIESLWRNRGRYILFGVLLAILGAVWLISLLLGTAAEQLRTDFVDTYGRAVMLEEIGYTASVLDEDTCARFNDPALVESMQFICHVQADVFAHILRPDRAQPEGEKQLWQVAGYDYTSEYSPFTRRADPFRLIEGRLPERDSECMVFADTFETLQNNGLVSRVGDQIKVVSYALSYEEISHGMQRGAISPLFLDMPICDERVLMIVGIVDRDSVDDYRYQTVYSPLNKSDGSVEMLARTPQILFVTYDEADHYPAFGETEPGKPTNHSMASLDSPKYKLTSRIDVLYRLRDAEDFDAFAEQVKQYNDELLDVEMRRRFAISGIVEQTEENYIAYKYLPSIRFPLPTFRARTYIDGFAELISPLERLGALSGQMSSNFTLLAVVLFIILTVLNLYARTYEIGVLRCVGMSRGRIALDLMVEHGLFLGVSLLLGIAVAALAADTVIPRLLDAAYRDYLTGALDGLLPATGRILGTGLCLTVLATVGSVVYIQRCRPLAILRNRS